MVAIRGRWAPQKPVVQESQVSVWSHHGPVWGPDKYLVVKPLDVGVGPGGEAGTGLRRRFSDVGLAGPCLAFSEADISYCGTSIIGGGTGRAPGHRAPL